MEAGTGGVAKYWIATPPPPPPPHHPRNSPNEQYKLGCQNLFLRHECIQKKIIPYLREIGQKKFCQAFFILLGNSKMVILSK